jgi:hypothetical protein
MGTMKRTRDAMERNSTHPSIDDVRVGVASLGVVDANVVRSSESNPFVKSRTESQGDFSNYDPSQIHPKGRNPATGRSIDRFPIRTPTDVPGGVATGRSFVSRRIKMHTYLLATLERDAVVGAATATVLKEAMADMMCTRSQCVRGAKARAHGRSRSRFRFWFFY